MKKSKFTEQQIAFALQQAEGGHLTWSRVFPVMRVTAQV